MSDLLLRCEVCQSVIDEEDLFCSNCGREAPRRSNTARRSSHDTTRVATNNFSCTGCGASMSYDAKSQTLRCPFCGGTSMERRPDARVLSPRSVIPFAIGHSEAVSIMQRELASGFWQPGDLAKESSLVHMVPVYAPFWIFRAKTHTYWTADTNRTPPGASADWYPLYGEHHGEHSDILVGASQALTPAESFAICPFKLEAAVPVDQVDLDNVTVEQFSLPRKFARSIARHNLEQAETQAVERLYVPGRARNVRVNMLVSEMGSEPVLLPVWVMAYRYKDKVHRFLVNGQTGRPHGSVPVSPWKVVGAGVVAVVGVLLIFLLLAMFLT